MQAAGTFWAAEGLGEGDGPRPQQLARGRWPREAPAAWTVLPRHQSPSRSLEVGRGLGFRDRLGVGGCGGLGELGGCGGLGGGVWVSPPGLNLDCKAVDKAGSAGRFETDQGGRLAL